MYIITSSVILLLHSPIYVTRYSYNMIPVAVVLIAVQCLIVGGSSSNCSSHLIGKELETSIVDTLSSMIGKATANTIYLKELRSTLNSVTDRLDDLEDMIKEGKLNSIGNKLSALEKTLEVSKESTDAIKEMVKSNEGLITEVQADVSASGRITARIKSRQEATMSEVRLISLYKMTDQSTDHLGGGGGHGSDLAVDGQFVFSQWAPDTPVRTISHTLQSSNQFLTIDLGAMFRIYRVKIWNSRHCGDCVDRFIGTQVYADDKLLGTATEREFIYDFQVEESDATYAKSVLLRQSRVENLHVVEVQVWGTGPFNEDDKFA